MYVNPDNLDENQLPDKKYFNNILTIKQVNDDEYNAAQFFYKKMKFKNLREYLKCYLKSDITLLTDTFNTFRKIIFNEFELDVCKYISAPSLSKDSALKYSKCKIEHIKDITIFNFIRKSVTGGLSDAINPFLKFDDINNEKISYLDISSMYPNELRKKVPVSDYKLIEQLDESKYGQNRDYGCFLLCDVKTTDKVKNDPLFSQCPMLVSKCKIPDKNLSEYQLNQIKEKRQSNNTHYNSQAEKLIPNLGLDSNVYLNFEMYQLMKKFGYEISVKKILEFKHAPIFKQYIEYLYSKKKEYSLKNKKAMEFCFKILMNSFYGVMLQDKTKHRNIRICTTKRQSLKFTKMPNFHSYKIINENLIIIELSKNKTIFDSPIAIGSQVLFNSKCNLYKYMYEILPKLFKKENIMYGFRDTDSIIFKIKNTPYEKYLKIIKENPDLFNKNMGLMELEYTENINEVISLRSKSNSNQRVSDINIKIDNNYTLRKSKGISKNYCKQNHTYQYFKDVLFDKIKKQNIIRLF